MNDEEGREALRQDIKSKLTKIIELLNDDKDLRNKIVCIRRDISKAITAANKKSKHINACKHDVELKLRAVDAILQELEDR